MQNVQQIELSNGLTVLIEPLQTPVESDVKWGARKFSSDELMKAIVGLAQDLNHAFASVSLAKATLEFGVGFAIETDGLTALLVKVSGEASFKVTVEVDRRQVQIDSGSGAEAQKPEG